MPVALDDLPREVAILVRLESNLPLASELARDRGVPEAVERSARDPSTKAVLQLVDDVLVERQEKGVTGSQVARGLNKRCGLAAAGNRIDRSIAAPVANPIKDRLLVGAGLTHWGPPAH